MTEFQAKCRRAVEELLTEFRFGWECQEIPSVGDKSLGTRPGDIYLKYKLDSRAGDLEVYIYDDEAGYLKKGRWTIFETQDYASTSALLQAFLARLRANWQGC